MRPPVPTSDQLPKDEARKQRRAALVPVIVGLVIVLGLAGFSALNRSAPPVVATFHTGDMSLDGAFESNVDEHGQPIDTGSIFRPPVSVDELLLLRSNDESLSDEPAGLAHLAQGKRIAAFARNEGQRREEYAFWNIRDTPMAEVISFYEQAALDQQFHRIPTTPKTTTPEPTAPTTAPDVPTTQDNPPAQATTLLFRRIGRRDNEDDQKKPSAFDVLVIRTKPIDDGQVHVSLWYVQTNPTAPN